MTEQQQNKFFEAVEPSIRRMSAKWFEPGLKSPDGYSYGCSRCDMNCGSYRHHDEDCLIQICHDLVQQFAETDESTEWDLKHPILAKKQGPERPLAEILFFKTFTKVRAILSKLYGPFLNRLVPLDLDDPEHQNVICYCADRSKNRAARHVHEPDCVDQIFAQALSDLFNTKK